MQHLTEEQLVLHHYHDGDAAADVAQHLGACAECRAQSETLTRVLSLVDPDATFEPTTLPDMHDETYRGHDGFRRALRRYTEPFEWMVVELEQIMDTGDRLISIHHVRAKARYTGIEFEYPAAYLWTFRDGKISHVQGFLDPQEALKAAGVEG